MNICIDFVYSNINEEIIIIFQEDFLYNVLNVIRKMLQDEKGC